MSDTNMAVTPLQALAEKKDWATALANSSLLPPAYQKAPANLLLAAEYADTLGVPRMTALTGIHIIKGKPSISADLMASLVRRAGHRLRVSGDARSAKATLIRADDPDYTYEATWNMDRAKQAGLVDKPASSWRTYPEALLRSRAITEVCRMGASEVLFGAIYAPEELGATVDGDGAPVEIPPITVDPTTPEVSEAHGMREDPPAGEDLWAQITWHADTLGLSRDTVAATLRYVCEDEGVSLDGLTVSQGEALADYLAGRVRERKHLDAVDAEIVIDDTDESGAGDES